MDIVNRKLTTKNICNIWLMSINRFNSHSINLKNIFCTYFLEICLNYKEHKWTMNGVYLIFCASEKSILMEWSITHRAVPRLSVLLIICACVAPVIRHSFSLRGSTKTRFVDTIAPLAVAVCIWRLRYSPELWKQPLLNLYAASTSFTGINADLKFTCKNYLQYPAKTLCKISGHCERMWPLCITNYIGLTHDHMGSCLMSHNLRHRIKKKKFSFTDPLQKITIMRANDFSLCSSVFIF